MEIQKYRHDVAALGFIASKYQPAKDQCEADYFLTNLEIVQAVHEHTGIQISILEVNNIMLDMGYKKDLMNEMKIVWLMKKAPNADN